MKRTWRQALTVLLALTLAVSLTQVVRKALDYRRGAETYASAVRVVDFPPLPEIPRKEPEAVPEEEKEDPTAAALAQLDLAALQEINGEVIGWITIPETGVSYPLLQGEDNRYYLDHMWTRDRSSVGAIFLDTACPADLSGFNAVIYGHRMRNGSMFGELRKYRDQDYWQAHPDVYIVNDSGVSRYRIFAACEAGVGALSYRLDLAKAEDREAMIDFALKYSVIDSGVTPDPESRVLTLVTCTGRGYASRWIVQAVLESGEPIEK